MQLGPLRQLAFAPDHGIEPFELARHGVVELDYFIESIGDFPVDVGEVAGEPDREIAALECAQGLEDVATLQ